MELQLKQGKKLLGILRAYDYDFPWVNCKFEPTESFKEVKALFDEELQLLELEDIEAWELICDRINDLNLHLINEQDGKDIGKFLLHIQDNEAWFRY